MSMKLSGFRVEALHGKRTINLDFKDNCLVLVGENGSGKSTIVNLLYYFLSCQWRRMRDYNFNSVTAVINGVSITVTRDMLHPYDEVEHYGPSARARRAVERIINDLGPDSLESLAHNESKLFQIARANEIPLSILYEYLRENVHTTEDRARQLTFGGRSRSKLAEVSDAIRGHVTAQILYLPTYRRIEHELKSIFPKLNIEDLDKYRQREESNLKRGMGGFVELVEFGMKDVEDMVDRTINRLREYIRIGLNALTASYLKDIINGAHKNLDLNELRRLDENKLIAFINNIDERTLAAFEKGRLRDIVQKIRREESLSVDEKVISHFLFKLAQLRQRQEQNEEKVRSFIGITNDYLIGKKFVYNDQEFLISIRSDDGALSKTKRTEEPAIASSDQIKMSMLSSGEKQIVSLFAHIYFSDEKEYFVIVDEPELSLSVIWQKKFLPDIMKTKRCSGIVAVTHSPFIYDNGFDVYARPLYQFVEPFNVAHR